MGPAACEPSTPRSHLPEFAVVFQPTACITQAIVRIIFRSGAIWQSNGYGCAWCYLEFDQKQRCLCCLFRASGGLGEAVLCQPYPLRIAEGALGAGVPLASVGNWCFPEEGSYMESCWSHRPLRPRVLTGESWEWGRAHPSAHRVLAGQGELCSVGNTNVLGCGFFPAETNYEWLIVLYRMDV